MNNIIKYVKDMGDSSFAERGFTDEDALVLSEFCYLKYDGLVAEEGEPVSLKDLNGNENREDLFWDKRYEKDNRTLYNAIVESKRFGSLKLGYYKNIIDVEKETQFSAITYFLEEGINIVTFRGTDETMVGWQEDFAMLLKKPIMGQTLSVEYLKRMSLILEGEFYVAGHSKGGNLAMYSVMFSDESIQNRIKRVLSFDGPGFRPELIAEKLNETVRAKAHTYIPRSSPIGIMLDTAGDRTIIEAKAIGPMQHNPYNWLIKEGRMVEAAFTEQHKLMVKSTNEWFFKLNEEETEEFVKIACWLIDSTKADTTIELQNNPTEHFKALYAAEKEADKDVKDMISSFMKSYLALAGDNIKNEVRDRYETLVTNVRKATGEAKNGLMVKRDEMIKTLQNKKSKNII